MNDFEKVKDELLEKLEKEADEDIKKRAQTQLIKINSYIIKYEQNATRIGLISEENRRKERIDLEFQQAAEQIQQQIEQQALEGDKATYYRTFVSAFERAANYINSVVKEKEQTRQKEKFTEKGVLKEGAELIHEIQSSVYGIDIPYTVSYVSTDEQGDKILVSSNVTAQEFFELFFPKHSYARESLGLSSTSSMKFFEKAEEGRLLNLGEAGDAFNKFYLLVQGMSKQFWTSEETPEGYVNEGNVVEAFLFVSKLIRDHDYLNPSSKSYSEKAFITMVMEAMNRTLANNIRGLNVGDIDILGESRQLKNINASVMSGPQIINTLLDMANDLNKIISGGKKELKEQIEKKFKEQIDARTSDATLLKAIEETVQKMVDAT